MDIQKDEVIYSENVIDLVFVLVLKVSNLIDDKEDSGVMDKVFVEGIKGIEVLLEVLLDVTDLLEIYKGIVEVGKEKRNFNVNWKI